MRKEKRRSVLTILVLVFFVLPSCTLLPLRTTSCYTVTEQLPLLENLIFIKHNTIYIFSPNAIEGIRLVANFTGGVANLHISPDGKYLLVPNIRETALEELPKDAAFLFEQSAGITATHYLESLALIEIETGAISNIKIPDMLRTYSLKGWFDSEWLLFEPVFGTRVVWEKSLNPPEVGDPAQWSPNGKYIAYYYYDSQSLVFLDMQGTEINNTHPV